jgi:hypothetical protein
MQTMNLNTLLVEAEPLGLLVVARVGFAVLVALSAIVLLLSCSGEATRRQN